MDPLNIIKIIAALITVVIALIAGFMELRLNPKFWLNRWFFIFFISTSLGFLIYTIYHLVPLITMNTQIITPLAITAQIFFNFIPVSLVMTVFILEDYKKIAMDFSHLGIMIIIFIIMSFGYFIWSPTLDNIDYIKSIVDTTTPRGWFIFVNILRIALFIYAIVKYAIMTRKVEEDTRKRIYWFFAGITLVIVGLLVNLLGGLFEFILLEILALIAINIGILIITKGFLS